MTRDRSKSPDRIEDRARPTPRPRLTVFRLLLAVAISAIGLHLTTRGAIDREAKRRERCLVIADHYARLGGEYRRNRVRGTVADWHEFMSRKFEALAMQPGTPIPSAPSMPPKGWRPDTSAGVDGPR